LLILASQFLSAKTAPFGHDGGRILRCLFCGTEYWLPSQVRRDPDFCSLEHREKYHERVELALRRIQESSAQPPRERAATPAAPPSALISRSRDEEVRQPIPKPRVSADPAQLKIPRMEARPIFERLQSEEPGPDEPDASVPKFLQIEPERLALNLSKVRQYAAVANLRKVRQYAVAANLPKVRRYAAAAAIAVIVLSLGPAAAKLATDLLNAPRQWVSSTTISNPAATVPPSLPARSEAGGIRHPVAWLRTAASRRATSYLAENFDGGMAAWGVQSKAWAPGWARSPDGYVRPGQLALFQPTLNYADYRMDFFGQIESNGMSWVVRGKDTQNYYAMKVNLLRAGLRPVLSMAHYPVVQGRRGHVVQVPLSVMIHNGMPYHVSVEVNGSHYTASIEGEEVDSWSDDTLLAGGVGFFADAGDRARIYWVKVLRNDDWFGRLCGQIAAPSQVRDTAQFRQRPLSILPVPKTGLVLPIASYFH
jgi:hypothetical protein